MGSSSKPPLVQQKEMLYHHLRNTSKVVAGAGKINLFARELSPVGISLEGEDKATFHRTTSSRKRWEEVVDS